jgi:hypothetical protein
MGRDTLKVMGASNHSEEERSKLDYYGTDPRSTRALLNVESFDAFIWEPCAGHHLISKELENSGYCVRTTDIADYGFGDEQLNFLETEKPWDGDIITNPPYGLSTEFAVKALELVKPGAKVAMFLRTLFLEGTKRYEKLFKDNPPKTVYIFTNRQVSDKNDDFNHGSAVSYSWFVWEKGYEGPTQLRWIKSSK